MLDVKNATAPCELIEEELLRIVGNAGQSLQIYGLLVFSKRQGGLMALGERYTKQKETLK